MTTTISPTADVQPLKALRRARWTQAITLSVVAGLSVVGGLVMMLRHPAEPAGDFRTAVGMEFVIWGIIDLAFGGVGVVQSSRTGRTPMTLQAEIDEFAAGERLLRALRFNHRLNLGYLLIAVALLAWARRADSAALAGHGVGVAVQGGFLLAFDWVWATRLTRVLGLDAAARR